MGEGQAQLPHPTLHKHTQTYPVPSKGVNGTLTLTTLATKGIYLAVDHGKDHGTGGLRATRLSGPSSSWSGSLSGEDQGGTLRTL